MRWFGSLAFSMLLLAPGLAHGQSDRIVVKAGAMPDHVLDVNGVKALATMPSREELLAKLMATMQAPIGQFVRTLNEVPARFVRTLAAVRDAKEKAAA